MSDERKPARDQYDAYLGMTVLPYLGHIEPVAYAIVKFTHAIVGERCLPAPAEPLFHNIHDDEIKPRLKQGTDFWPWKESTDFVVQGSAFAPNGTPVRQMTVSARVGNTQKSIAVFGTRMIEWAGGEVAWVPPPEPFTEMPLVWENAYGGLDWRVGPWKPGETPNYPWGLEVDHPGIYPRNPFGKGYTVLEGDVPGTEMPNLEDPDDLLSGERLVTRDPKTWYRMPIPWCFDWVHLMTFPRYCFFNSVVDAWFPGPEDDHMKEVRRNYIPKEYRTLMQRREESHPHQRFLQEASHGLIIKDMKGSESVSLKGMNATEPTLRFDLPAPLRTMEIEIEGQRETVRPRLHSVVCRPADKIVTLTYAGEMKLKRVFVPGVHKIIPISVRINGDKPVPFDTPQTSKETIAEALAKPQQPLPWENLLP